MPESLMRKVKAAAVASLLALGAGIPSAQQGDPLRAAADALGVTSIRTKVLFMASGTVATSSSPA